MEVRLPRPERNLPISGEVYSSFYVGFYGNKVVYYLGVFLNLLAVKLVALSLKFGK